MNYDAHNHVHDTPDLLINHKLRTTRMCLMGVHPADWPTVIACHLSDPDRFDMSFGIHPWFAHRYTLDGPHWTYLEALLGEYPSAHVGEIGLDRVAVDPTTKLRYPFDHQLAVCRLQMELAARYDRPVNMHCVRAHGHLLDLLRGWTSPYPRAIILHSYSGSADVLKALLKLKGVGERVYVSVSSVVSMRSPKWTTWSQHVPLDRLLIESDMHRWDAVDEAMDTVLTRLSEHLDMPRDILSQVLWDNSQRLFNIL
jgi:Tat protein secretion system quality control protein TatD with DNase activity